MTLASRKFTELMQQMHGIKQQLLQLHNIYSPNTINYHNNKQIQILKEEVQMAHSKLSQFQNQLVNNKQNELKEQKMLKQENQELIHINQQLVVSSDKFKNMFQTAQKQKQQLIRQVQEDRDTRRGLQAKFQKQMENMKLMHAQELYILRKKEKKS